MGEERAMLSFPEFFELAWGPWQGRVQRTKRTELFRKIPYNFELQKNYFRATGTTCQQAGTHTSAQKPPVFQYPKDSNIWKLPEDSKI
jgi:hypothetical protein